MRAAGDDVRSQRLRGKNDHNSDANPHPHVQNPRARVRLERAYTVGLQRAYTGIACPGGTNQGFSRLWSFAQPRELRVVARSKPDRIRQGRLDLVLRRYGPSGCLHGERASAAAEKERRARALDEERARPEGRRGENRYSEESSAHLVVVVSARRRSGRRSRSFVARMTLLVAVARW